MNRVTVVSGFLGGGENLTGLAEELSGPNGPYDDATPLTFVRALQDPDLFRRAAAGGPVVTHSAGGLVMRLMHESGSGTANHRPTEIQAIAPPLAASVPALLGRGGLVGMRMVMPGIGIREPNDVTAVNKFNAAYLGDARRNGKANIRQLASIGNFDAIRAATVLRERGTYATLTFLNGDAFFKLSLQREQEARAEKIRILRMDGEHNYPLVKPREFVRKYVELESRPTPHSGLQPLTERSP